MRETSGTAAVRNRPAMPDALTWAWSRFALGVAFALPSAVLAPLDPSLALALSVGVLPAAAFGLPPRRRARATIPLVGVLSAVGLLLGSTLALAPALAVLGLLVLAIGGSGLAARGRLGQLILVLVLPMVGIGLSFPLSARSVALAVAIVGGSVYAWLVSLLWPERKGRAPAGLPVPRGRAMLVYGVLLGLAAAIAAAIGFALGLEHVGWATASVLLVMRPVRGQVVLRSIGRATSVLAGALAAATFAMLTPSGLVVGLAIVAVMGALCAMQESRWYVAAGFTTFLVITLLLSTSSATPAQRLAERVLETLLGVALALLFGAVVPAALALLSRRRARDGV